MEDKIINNNYAVYVYVF